MAIELTYAECPDRSSFPVQIPKFDGLVPTTTGEGLTIRAMATDLTRLECPDSVEQLSSADSKV